jgi:proton-dependent oligopeptide transporter, POT family
MKSTVQALALFTSAVSAALGQALTGLSEDPLLVWNYGSVAVIAMIGGIGFFFTFRKADRDEDAMNNQKESAYLGSNDGGPVKAHEGSLDEKRASV